ncbi:putative bifunctional diguanylate cyclase/phosphodiesterase [Actinoplanes sp. NPDC049265]|uniref:putative bifunctional diguanylate cyclase/phosphodiesterase n=1 Tax=Actinoplanes sp. NPDC049265 TaxID=3363902 RepID=UPI00371F448D
MRAIGMQRRAVARTAIAALAAGLALLAGLGLFSTRSTAQATARIAAAEQVTRQWGQVYLLIGIEYEQLVDFVRADSDVGRGPLLSSIGSAEENLRWLNAHGGPAESFQAQTLQNTYGGYSYTLRDLIDAQKRGDRERMDSDAKQAALSASALRKQASVNIARNNLEMGVLLEQTQRNNHRVLLAVEVISVIDLLLVVLCALVLVAYQRGTERQARDSRHQAMHDSLTGVANRNLLIERLDEAVAAAGGAGLLLLDLDHFKEVNDTLGHLVGDRLIQEVADRLTEAARHQDTVARLGGDEFAVVLPDIRSAEDLMAVGERILETLCRPAELDGYVVDVNASIGAALHPLPSGSATELLRHADVAMYTAKRNRLGVALYDAAQDENSTEKLTAGAELRNAIENGELEVHYQPKVRVGDRTPTGVEALVRWRHPARGLLGPDRFIPVAEQNGLIRPLTDVVLSAALAQSRAWREAGLSLPVAVNAGADCLHDLGFPAHVRSIMDLYDTQPGELTVEITESMVIADPCRAATILGELRELGVRVSIDDFGTGYSSMSYLQEMPLDELKIDRRFTTRIETEGSGRAIVAAIADLAHACGLHVVVEGVEHEETVAILDEIGCEAAQGYLFCRPRPADEITAWALTADRPDQTLVS